MGFRLQRIFVAQLIAIAWVFLYEGNPVVSFDNTAPSRRAPWKHHGHLIRTSAASLAMLHGNENENIDENSNNEKPLASSSSVATEIPRRFVIGAILSVPWSSLAMPSMAAAGGDIDETPKAEKKPFAPLENLLPAVRVKRSIDASIDLAQSLVAAESAQAQETATTTTALARLETLLLAPQNYVQPGLQLQGVPQKPADLYLKSYRNTKGDLPFQKALIQSGDVDAWKRLKNREKTLERESPVRTALNAYTDALSFSGDSYLLNVDRQTRSSMVREDRLPDLKQVITSDMGMRYLYRNQVLTAMDDVKAELEYQLRQRRSNSSSNSNSNSNAFDGSDLLDLLYLARGAIDRWLSLVPPGDVEEAVKAVAAEEQ